MHRSSQRDISEAQAQSDRGIDVVALEKAVSQSAIHFREHDAGIEIPLRCKPPIDNARDRVERTGALWVLAAGAGRGPPRGGAEEGILGVMVIGRDHIQFVGKAVFHTGPHDLKNLVAKTVDTESCIDNVRVVDQSTALAKRGSRDIRESGLRIARRHICNSFVTGVQLQSSDGVFGR
jgi:hypothetical protein